MMASRSPFESPGGLRPNKAGCWFRPLRSAALSNKVVRLTQRNDLPAILGTLWQHHRVLSGLRRRCATQLGAQPLGSAATKEPWRKNLSEPVCTSSPVRCVIHRTPSSVFSGATSSEHLDGCCSPHAVERPPFPERSCSPASAPRMALS